MASKESIKICERNVRIMYKRVQINNTIVEMDILNIRIMDISAFHSGVDI